MTDDRSPMIGMLHLATGRSAASCCPGGFVLIGILLALLVVVVGVSVTTWIRRARACQRIIGAPAGELELACYGGVMCRAMMTSGTLVRLDLLDWGVRMRGVPLTRWYMPQWEARYEELAIAELVATKHSRITVWFRVREEPGGMGFMSYRSRDILDGLQRHEVPVNRSVQQISSPADMYSKQR
jgi:hypothetical protein